MSRSNTRSETPIVRWSKVVNTAKIRRNKQQSESEEYAKSEEGKEKRRMRKMQVANEHQIMQMTGGYIRISILDL